MADSIKLDFQGTDQKAIKQISASVEISAIAVAEQLRKELARLRHYIITQKLSGQVLRKDSGALIDSVRPDPVVLRGLIVEGSIRAGGPTAPYASYFEKGGKGPYTIRARQKKALGFLVDGPVARDESVLRQVRRGLAFRTEARLPYVKKFVDMGGVVAKSVVHPGIPHRPFMQPALDEKQDDIVNELRLAQKRVLKNLGKL